MPPGAVFASKLSGRPLSRDPAEPSFRGSLDQAPHVYVSAVGCAAFAHTASTLRPRRRHEMSRRTAVTARQPRTPPRREFEEHWGETGGTPEVTYEEI